ncbi:hypothetical protein [Eggerthella sinensis]|uniref:hypothetical protein n=1 Tax=Eggerthella sinensis TaxID=242230 RepID=UPI00248DF948|nr:hypothetical protein [Eggerthella sinensis]
MNGRISWGAYSGEDIERIIATYICRMFPNSVHIRPSSGDGGIDVFRTLENGSIVVYQIKKFASNLTNSQKQQIKHSWKSLREYIKEEALVLAQWNLTIPLNPTKENLIWFEELTSESHAEAHWVGLTQIEDWAARMPDIGDYYINGNYLAKTEEIKRFLEAAGFPDITNRKGMRDKLVSIQNILNDSDPNYVYDLHLISGFTCDESFVLRSKPGLIMTSLEDLPGGGMVKIDVFARHAAATELDPIKTNVMFLADTDEDRERLKDFIDYGTPLKRFPARIKENHRNCLFGAEKESLSGTVSIMAYESEKKFDLALLNACGHSIPVKQQVHHSGRRGFVWKGADDMGVLSIDMKGTDIDGKLVYTIKSDLGALAGLSLGNARRRLNFFQEGITHPLVVKLEEIELLEFSSKDVGLSEDYISEALALVNALELIDGVSSEEVLYPSIGDLTVREHDDLMANARLVANGINGKKWTKLGFVPSTRETPEKPLLLTHIFPLRTTVAGKQYECGLVQSFFIGKWEGSDEGMAFCPTEEYGNDLIEKVIEQRHETLQKSGQLFAIPAPPICEWEDMVKKGCSFQNEPEERDS